MRRLQRKGCFPVQQPAQTRAAQLKACLIHSYACSIAHGSLPLHPNFQNAVAMDPFLAYSIPIQGLKTGIHQFKFRLDREFFRHFEGSPIEDGLVEVALQLDKRPDMLVLDFTFSGHNHTTCDRCTADIRLPFEGERQLLVKYGNAEGEEEDEVVFISREAPSLNIAPFLYEFAILALPITNTYDCQSEKDPPCNFEILKYLEQNAEERDTDPIWDVLNGLK